MGYKGPGVGGQGFQVESWSIGQRLWIQNLYLTQRVLCTDRVECRASILGINPLG